MPRVEPGQKVYFTILGDPDNRIEATLRAVEPAPESISDDSTTSSTSTAIYYNGLFDVENPDRRLRISMTAQVTIVLSSAEQVLTIPASVLGRKGPDGAYMLAVWNEAEQRQEPRPVEIGLNNKVTAVVLSGLEEGDRVVSGAAASPRAPGAASGSSRNLLGGGLGRAAGGAGGPPPM